MWCWCSTLVSLLSIICTLAEPEIYSMQIYANVSNRYVQTLITSRIRNTETESEETTFSVAIPDNAFISEFEMEINNQVYKAFVKGTDEAERIYKQAVSFGQSAAHVYINPRDSKTFRILVNLEPKTKAIFRFAYEELLQRIDDQYELVINIRLEQIIDDLGIKVHIQESRPLTFVKNPPLRTGNQITKSLQKDQLMSEIIWFDNERKEAIVKFNPDKKYQKQLAAQLGGAPTKGIAGQFVVQYDVQRDLQGGEVLVKDGYFVNFFAPTIVAPRPKHVVFVLDHSVSMRGRKFDQLVDSMQHILSDLSNQDMFNIIRFETATQFWRAAENRFEKLFLRKYQYGSLETYLQKYNHLNPVQATSDNIKKAKNIVKKTGGMGATNLIEGLEVGLYLIKKNKKSYPYKYQPIIVLLSDGFPNVGVSNPDNIIKIINEVNTNSVNAAIFTLSYGDGADKEFLRKLSLANNGVSRHIYEASDASLQLQEFYKTISSPLLSNVKFTYADGVSHLTKTDHAILFKGSELIVSGKTGQNSNILQSVGGTGLENQEVSFTASTKTSVGPLERLWAYLTIKQTLENYEITKSRELKKKALDLALLYSFVTPVTSLVVVKPNGQTKSLNPWKPTVRGTFDLRGAFGEPLPEWLVKIRDENRTFTTSSGSYKVGTSSEMVGRTYCLSPYMNNTGHCTSIFECQEMFPKLRDQDDWMLYFCEENEFAGICCPNTESSPSEDILWS